MRKHLTTLALGLTLGLSILAPRPAAALSCVHPKEQLPRLALIVEGRVERVAPRFRLPNSHEQPEDITLTVSRYYKGEGPAVLEAVFDGIGWETMNPVGSNVIMGFMIDEDGNYKSGACTLRTNVQPGNAFESELVTLVRTQYGEGRAPNAAPEPTPDSVEPRGQWVLWTSLGALAALITAMRLRRRQTKR